MSREQRLNGASEKRVLQVWDDAADMHEREQQLEAAYDLLEVELTRLRTAMQDALNSLKDGYSLSAAYTLRRALGGVKP